MLTAEYRIVLYAVALLIGLAIFAKVRSRGARQAVLLIGSYALYATWGLWFAAVLLASTVMNFLFGLWLRRKPSALVLWIGIVCNLLLLGSFKYLPEFADSIGSLHEFSHIALPLGISFWTFQAMSYLFDLYRGEELDPSFVGVRALHGVLSGGDLRADLPPARHAAAVSLGRACAAQRRDARNQPHCDRRADDAVGSIAGTRHPERGRHQRRLR